MQHSVQATERKGEGPRARALFELDEVEADRAVLQAFESFSENPHLSGHITAAYIDGLQQNGIAGSSKLRKLWLVLGFALARADELAPDAAPGL